MRSFFDKKRQAWEAHHQQFKCDHDLTDLRRRIIRGGAVQYVNQCLNCGESQNQPVAKAKALAESDGIEPAPFDESLKARFKQLRDDSAKSIMDQFDRNAFLTEYSPYLNSDAWAKRRSLVMQRTQGLCEGCRETRASEVHHLTYEHVGNEFLFELVALCMACHERLHADGHAE
jgi:5-methylcytosine-specific restriction endonuclease McrA